MGIIAGSVIGIIVIIFIFTNINDLFPKEVEEFAREVELTNPVQKYEINTECDFVNFLLTLEKQQKGQKLLQQNKEEINRIFLDRLDSFTSTENALWMVEIPADLIIDEFSINPKLKNFVTYTFSGTYASNWMEKAKLTNPDCKVYESTIKSNEEFNSRTLIPEEGILEVGEKRFNILVIMVDDLDVGSLKISLEHDLMPNLQTFIVDRGTDFTNSFVTTSLCCPSRATLLTGQYSHNHHVKTNNDILNFNDNSTLATWLHDDGYHTGLIGKYLNGYGEKTNPTYIPPGWDRFYAFVSTGQSVYDYQINENGIVVSYGNKTSDYRTDVLASKIPEFLNEAETMNDESPFFLLVTPQAPHFETSEGCVEDQGHGRIPLIRPPVRYNDTVTVDFLKSPSFNETDVSDKPLWIRKQNYLNSEERDCI